MTRRLVVAVFGGFFLASIVSAAVPRSWKEIPIPELRKFETPKIPKQVLRNGIVVYLNEDHELPLIDLEVRIRTGGRYVPATKTGLDRIFGEVWRTGGTKSRTGDDLDDYLEAKAAKVETWMGGEAGGVSLNCLAKDFDDVVKVLEDVLRNPNFAEDKIVVAKKKVESGIARRNDEVFSISMREARKLVYGADSPYSRVPEYATVRAVTRDDLLAWHGRYVRPERIMIGVSGDFNQKKMIALLNKTFGSWKAGKLEPDPEIPPGQAPNGGVYFVEKSDVTQAEIALVDVGIRQDNPDFYAVRVMNEILSGSFGSRLFKNVRSKKGLAYSVYGGVFPSFDHEGVTWIGMGTKSGSTVAAVHALYEEIDGIVGKNPVTDEELDRAKDSLLNSFIFRVDSGDKVLGQAMNYAYYGYPEDRLAHFQEEIQKVTKEDVMRVAAKYLHKDRMALLVVGKSADFDKPLATLGKVTAIDIAIPPPPDETAVAAGPEAEKQGRKLLAKVIEGLGGSSAIAKVKAVEILADSFRVSPMGKQAFKTRALLDFSGRIRYEMKMGPQGMVMAADAGGGFMAFGGQTRELPGSQRAELLTELHREPVYVAAHASDKGLKVLAGGSEELDGTTVASLSVEYGRAKSRWLVDPGSGEILQIEYQSMGPQGPSKTVQKMTDYRSVNGVRFSFAQTVLQDGKPAGETKVEAYHLNPSIDDAAFKAPAK